MPTKYLKLAFRIPFCLFLDFVLYLSSNTHLPSFLYLFQIFFKQLFLKIFSFIHCEIFEISKSSDWKLSKLNNENFEI